MTTPKLELIGLTKAFGAKQVLRGVNLRVEAGQSLVIIGGSGTGKSVMIKCILGLLRPDAGDVRVDGQSVLGLTGKARQQFLMRIGMLFQGAALFDSLPIWRNVAFGLIQGRGMAARTARRLAIETLERVGLGADVADLFPSELSGGMQKRVGLARAIAAKPEIVFFDEPTTGLDPIMADVINALIVERVRDLGATTLSITHDMGSVRKIADRVAMLHQGEIVWDGPRAQIDASGNAYVDQFVHGKAEGPISTLTGRR